MPAPSGTDEITGETRYRTGWFGKLILQVEEVYHVAIYGRPRFGGIERVQRTKWRDATVRDLRLIDWYERSARAKAEGQPPPCPPDQYATLNGRAA
jgi:hypothetical protein